MRKSLNKKTFVVDQFIFDTCNGWCIYDSDNYYFLDKNLLLDAKIISNTTATFNSRRYAISVLRKHYPRCEVISFNDHIERTVKYIQEILDQYRNR